MSKKWAKLASVLGAILIWAGEAQAQTAVTGNLKDAGLTNVTSANTFVRFELRNYGSNVPRVSGTGVIVSPVRDFTPDSVGVISGSIAGNDIITPAGTFYRACYWENGKLFRCADYNLAGASFNLNSATPISSVPTASVDTFGTRVYLHIQTTAATNWTISHNLNDQNVMATFFDAGAPPQQIFPDSVKLTDSNTLTATFTVAQAGRAIVIDAGNMALASGGVSLSDVVVKNPAANQSIVGAYDLNIGGNFLPNATGQDLGAAGAQRWDGFLRDVDLSGTFTLGGTARVASSIIPALNITYDLGSASLRWNDIHAATLRLGTSLPTTGAIRLDNNTFVYSKQVTTGSNNIPLLGLNSNNEVEIGSANFGGSDAVTLAPSGTTKVNQLRVSSTGSILSKYIRVAASLDFTALAANTCEVLTLTATGAIDGNTVSLGIPNALADVDGATERTVFFAWVNAVDTVSVRRCNVTGAATADPAAALVTVTVTN